MQENNDNHLKINNLENLIDIFNDIKYEKCNEVIKINFKNKNNINIKNNDKEFGNECSDDDASVFSEESETSCENNEGFDNEEIDELIESILIVLDDIIHSNPLKYSEPDFHNKLEISLYEILENHFEEDLPDIMEEQIEFVVEHVLNYYFNTILPWRSYKTSFIQKSPNIPTISKKINYLKSIPQPEQRTSAWYLFRYNLITASNAWKAFKTDSCMNQLICEKCKPLLMNASSNENMDDNDIEECILQSKDFVNTNSPMHWGQKYEKISVLLYEYEYNTMIGEFGCIKHPKYGFLGASPDGINIDKKSDRYGRMLEIKNIVNREINGIPKEEYWIQMQLQMEVCDLDECDFLETRFKEYESEEDFLQDALDEETSYQYTRENKIKGIIVYFMKDNKPYYEYAPLLCNKEEFEEWNNKIHEENNKYTWLKNIYWYLEEKSCVLVERNKVWFQYAIPKLEEVWNIIVQERKTGYEHRMPKKKVVTKKTNEENSLLNPSNSLGSQGCLLLFHNLELNIPDCLPQSNSL